MGTRDGHGVKQAAWGRGRAAGQVELKGAGVAARWGSRHARRWRDARPSAHRPCAPQVTATNVDIAKVAPAWHLYTPEEVEAVIARL